MKTWKRTRSHYRLSRDTDLVEAAIGEALSACHWVAIVQMVVSVWYEKYLNVWLFVRTFICNCPVSAASVCKRVERESDREGDRDYGAEETRWKRSTRDTLLFMLHSPAQYFLHPSKPHVCTIFFHCPPIPLSLRSTPSFVHSLAHSPDSSIPFHSISYHSIPFSSKTIQKINLPVPSTTFTLLHRTVAIPVAHIDWR